MRPRLCAPGRTPTCGELVCAPELAILVSLEAAINVAIVALVAAQPELWPNTHQRVVITTTAAEGAEDVIHCAQALAAAIADYCAALPDERDAF
jgi:hypothetical protein